MHKVYEVNFSKVYFQMYFDVEIKKNTLNQNDKRIFD